MPFPNEHAARQSEPGQYDKFRRSNDQGGAGVHFIYGIKDGKSEVQSVRFDKSKFTPEEAKAWLEKHKMKTGVVAATGKSDHDEAGGSSANPAGASTGPSPAGASAITVPTALRTTSVQYKNHQEKAKDLEMDSDELVDALIEHPEIPLSALKEGCEHELEHTDNKAIALKIAMDHLMEHADYYQRLAAVFPKDHAEAKDHAEYAMPLKDKEDDDDDEDEELGFSEDGKSLTVEAFASGTHTDAGGNTQEWSEADLDDIASKATAQIPKKPIPICIGHPNDNSPAFGWVESLKRSGKKLIAKLTELNPNFVEALKSGSFKGRSISLYDDNRVRHLGFLGAAQPAVEGLNPLKFTENNEHFKLYEFKEPDMDKIAELEKKVAWYDKLFAIFKKEVNFSEIQEKEPIMEDKKVEEVVTKDHHEAETVVAKENGAVVSASESGPAINDDIKAKETKDSGVLDTSKVQAAEAKNDANDVAKENEELKAKVQALESKIATMEAAFGKEKEINNTSFCETLVKEGKLRPADVDMTLLALNSMAEIDAVTVKNSVNFSEGKIVVPPVSGRLETYKKKLMEMPKVIEFGEFPNLPSAEEAHTFPAATSMTAMIEKKMNEKMAASDKLGLTNKVSYWDVMKECMSECAKEFPKEYKEYSDSMLPKIGG
jgi:hypothetical protein